MEMNANHIVTQSNSLIDARYHEPLTARQQKIVLSIVSMIQPADENFKTYEIRIRDFHEMLGLEGDPKYTELRIVTEQMLKKSLEITREKGRLLQVNWFSSIEYFEHEGKMEFSFDPKLKPYLLDLKKAFTSYRLSNVLSLKTAYAIRLYELMKKWQHLGKWEITIENLKGKFGISQDKYKQYGHFKSRAILPSVKEVNEKTDVEVTFKEIRKGRKVVKIEFTIKHCKEKEITIDKLKKDPKVTTENEERLDRFNSLATGYNFDQIYFAEIYDVARTIWEDKAESELEFLIRYVNEEKSVKNPLGFIKSKLKEAWEFYQAEFLITFANLKPSQRRTGRTEVVPEWFNSQDEPQETPELTEELQKKKRELLARIGLSPEEIEKRMKENR